MREAYPGAIYYYTGRSFRVYRVNVHTKVANVRREKSYSTKPQMLPTLVFPNLTPDNVFKSSSCGELLAVECNLQVRESIHDVAPPGGPAARRRRTWAAGSRLRCKPCEEPALSCLSL